MHKDHKRRTSWSCACLLLTIWLSIAAVPWFGAGPVLAQGMSSWFVLPNVFYSPDTGFGGGVAGALFLESADTARMSWIRAAVTYAEKKQFSVEFLPTLYLGEGDWRVEVEAAARDYPSVFYGVGRNARPEDEEGFSLRSYEARLTTLRRVLPRLHAGMACRYFDGSVTGLEAGGLLEEGDVEGCGGGTVSGVGPVLMWDTRDSDTYTLAGAMVEMSAVFHFGSLGSDYDFIRSVVDLRVFGEVVPGHSIGMQSYVCAVSGDVPFFELPAFGGVRHMRGYQEGRFRDDVFATIQTEYRFPLWRRLRGALFASAGEVAQGAGGLSFAGLEYAAGGGLRYRLGEGGLHVRVDYAVGSETGGLYLTIGEAF